MKEINCNHVCHYWGSGRHEIVNAAGLQVHKSKLDIYLNGRHKVEIWYKSDITVTQLQGIKKHSYSTVKKLFDWPGILSFIFPFIKELPNADFCVENVRDSQTNGGVPIIPEGQPQKCTPKTFREYVKERGDHKICFKWDKKKVEGYDVKDIPPGAIVFVEGYGIFASLIKWFQNRTKRYISKLLKSS